MMTSPEALTEAKAANTELAEYRAELDTYSTALHLHNTGRKLLTADEYAAAEYNQYDLMRTLIALQAERIASLERENAAAVVYQLLMQWNGRGERTPYALLATLEQAQEYIFEVPLSATEWDMHTGKNDERQWRRVTRHRYNDDDDTYSVHWTILEMPIVRALAADAGNGEAT